MAPDNPLIENVEHHGIVGVERIRDWQSCGTMAAAASCMIALKKSKGVDHSICRQKEGLPKNQSIG